MPKFCENVTVDNVQIYNHYVQGHNTDGINPYGTKNVVISNTGACCLTCSAEAGCDEHDITLTQVYISVYICI